MGVEESFFHVGVVFSGLVSRRWKMSAPGGDGADGDVGLGGRPSERLM